MSRGARSSRGNSRSSTTLSNTGGLLSRQGRAGEQPAAKLERDQREAAGEDDPQLELRPSREQAGGEGGVLSGEAEVVQGADRAAVDWAADETCDEPVLRRVDERVHGAKRSSVGRHRVGLLVEAAKVEVRAEDERQHEEGGPGDE